MLAVVPAPPTFAIGSGSIAGAVTNEAGVGIANVEVRAYVPTAPAVEAWGTTGADGTYLVTGLDAGSYVVAFRTMDYGLDYVAEFYADAPTSSTATLVTVANAQAVTGIDAELAEAATISGVVTDEGGAPVAGLHVVAVTSGRPAFHAFTDASGTYSVHGLVAGDYTVRFLTGPQYAYVEEYWEDSHDWRHMTPLPLAAGEARADVDAVLTFAAAVSGTVLSAFDHPLPGTWVDFAPVDGGRTYGAYAGSGAFRLPGLPPGAYWVFARTSGPSGYLNDGYDETHVPADAQVVTLEPARELTDLRVRLAWSGGIRGVVTDASARPVAGVRVTAVHQGEPGELQAVTGPDGAYELSVPGGTYTVAFTSDSTTPRYAVAYYDGAVDAYAAQPVTVQADAWVSEIDAALVAYGAIAGVVTDPTGAPVAGVSVTALRGATEVHAVTTLDGSYRLDVPPGSYTVRFDAGPEAGLRPEYYNGALTAVDADAVTVGEGATTPGVDAQLEWEDRFSDVAPGQVFFHDIVWLADQGITSGYPDSTFRPAAPVTREAMAAFLFRFADGTISDGHAPVSFSDVDTGNPFHAEIEWLSGERITTGWPDGSFRPGALIERQAMAAFLYRFAGSPEFTPPTTSPFVDLRSGDPFYAEICWLASEGISTGTVTPSGAYFKPSDPIERQAMAAFLHRMSL